MYVEFRTQISGVFDNKGCLLSARLDHYRDVIRAQSSRSVLSGAGISIG